jgi:FkbH-like protein
MYESEVNGAVESVDAIPPEVRRQFAETGMQVVARTTLPWGEHCTECVWPTCYTTCALYSPRIDGGCRQFIDGMVRLPHGLGAAPYLLKLRFKAWGKLWTVGNLHLRSLSQASAAERLNIAVGALARYTPAPRVIQPRLLRKVNYLRRRAAEEAQPTAYPADCFLLECYNPGPARIPLTFTVRAVADPRRQFQTLVNADPGYTRARVPLDEIRATIDVRQPFEAEIVPNGGDDTVLYFGLIDFVTERPQPRLRSDDPLAPVGRASASASARLSDRKWKCIVWDLDNTLWDGILVEDGAEKIRLRTGIIDVIRQLDRRGILQSIASKNHESEVLRVLSSLGIDEYFLYPQIHWQPKSESIKRIAQALNIGTDTIAFVDDQPFELEEVRAVLPEVASVDAAIAIELAQRSETDVPVTEESANRRRMYREQERREVALASSGGDYAVFLRSCGLRVRTVGLSDSNIKRVYELAQRTNQLNFSGNRYSEAELRAVMASAHLETHVIHCVDRFGDYGIVGFAIIDTREPRLLDLMFSCRVQSKRVEHAVLSFLVRGANERAARDFYANYRKTVKNTPGGRVFEELGFEQVGETDGVSTLVFRKSRIIPDERIVQFENELLVGAAGFGEPAAPIGRFAKSMESDGSR